VLQLTYTMAIEYLNEGVRVNSVVLGPNDGDTARGTFSKYAEYLGSSHPELAAERFHETFPKFAAVDVGCFPHAPGFRTTPSC
jgi:NAD(P)-dependent dehydrogenase (short-subunit alcohol dehydrogenase family)